MDRFDLMVVLSNLCGLPYTQAAEVVQHLYEWREYPSTMEIEGADLRDFLREARRYALLKGYLE